MSLPCDEKIAVGIFRPRDLGIIKQNQLSYLKNDLPFYPPTSPEWGNWAEFPVYIWAGATKEPGFVYAFRNRAF